MGLLDALFPASDGGGLLDFLKRNANAAIANQTIGAPGDVTQYGPSPSVQAPIAQAPLPPVNPVQMPSANAPSPLDNAQWPAGPIGAPSSANAQMPTPSAPSAAPMPVPSVMPTPVASSSGGLSAMGRGALANMQNGPLGMLFGGIAGLAGMGQPTPQQIQAQTANFTARALIAKGVSPQDAIAAVQPGNGEMLKQLLTSNYGPSKYSVVQTGQDGMGNKTFSTLDQTSGELKPVSGNSTGAASSGGIGDMTKTGADYLATVPPQQAQIIKGMVDGTLQPPSSFALAKPAWQAMLAGAKNVDPNFDANTWAARHKMFTDLSASGNSSMGGILANGKSAFEHLREVSNKFADLGNISHDYPGGGTVAGIENYVGNVMTPSSQTKGKLAAANDALMRYGQESTKFYAGSGGGEAERMGALVNMKPATTSGEEQASYLSTEKNLMLDRLHQKERQIRAVMGDAFLQQHPVFTPELQKTISAIDANISKLRGQGTPASTAAPAAPPPPKVGAIQDGYRFKGGDPSDKNNWEPTA